MSSVIVWHKSLWQSCVQVVASASWQRKSGEKKELNECQMHTARKWCKGEELLHSPVGFGPDDHNVSMCGLYCSNMQCSDNGTGDVREIPNGLQKSYDQAVGKRAFLSPCDHRNVTK